MINRTLKVCELLCKRTLEHIYCFPGMECMHQIKHTLRIQIKHGKAVNFTCKNQSIKRTQQ